MSPELRGGMSRLGVENSGGREELGLREVGSTKKPAGFGEILANPLAP